jgi:hypothetical protein
MPPWQAAPGFGQFDNDPTLTSYEIELLLSWTDRGMPRGTSDAARAADPSPASAADMTLRVAADTPVRSRTQRYTLRSLQRSERWIHGWEFLPGNEAIVRRATVSIAPDTVLGVWVPPKRPVFLPDGIAIRLPAEATVTLEIEYSQPLEPAVDRSALALFFGAPPAHELQRTRLTRGTTTLAADTSVVSIRPQLAAHGESIRVFAQRPGGETEALLWVRDYDAAYAPTYRFRQPVMLPRGSRVDVFSFDDSAAAWIEYFDATARRRPGS